MTNNLIRLEFECLDETGRYISSVIAGKRRHMYVLHYLDFPDFIQIVPFQVKQSIIEKTIVFLFGIEGIPPRVKHFRSKLVNDRELA